jgi:hypothetical protein
VLKQAKNVVSASFGTHPEGDENVDPLQGRQQLLDDFLEVITIYQGIMVKLRSDENFTDEEIHALQG